MAIHVLSTSLPTAQIEVRVPQNHAAHGYVGHPVTETALVDTGATITAISPSIRKQLQPPPFGTVLYQPRGQHAIWVPTYLVLLVIEPHTHSGRVFPLEVIEEQPATPGVQLLLGCDLLRKVVLVWDGPRDRLLLTY